MADWLPARDFNLRHTLECGQYFRWRRDGDGYVVQSADRCFRVSQKGDRLLFEGEDGWFLQHFFSLDHDLREIRGAIDHDPVIREALDRYWGLRLIRQDPWECVASFVTSIASNIPRITRNIEDMARETGESMERFDRRVFIFPRPERLAPEGVLRRLKLGFRAAYLEQAARLAAAGMLDDITCANLGDARDSLMCIPGVAEKVADCVLLFGFGRLDAFPVDTWIRKAMTRFYFRNRRTSDDAIRTFANERFGGFAGYAQQYLFVHARENWKELSQRPIPKRSETTKIIRVSKAARVRELVDAVLAER